MLVNRECTNQRARVMFTHSEDKGTVSRGWWSHEIYILLICVECLGGYSANYVLLFVCVELNNVCGFWNIYSIALTYLLLFHVSNITAEMFFLTSWSTQCIIINIWETGTVNIYIKQNCLEDTSQSNRLLGLG